MLRVLILALLLPGAAFQDLNKIVERADQLLEEAKAGYERAKEGNSPAPFIEAGFKLEEARIKYLVLQEIGGADRQKLAIDRLRAVNQLAKLINDGRVAVATPPGEAPPASGAAPAAAPPSASELAAPALRIDVSKRPTVPDDAKVKEAVKLVRELFKDQYAKKAWADRRALARTLMTEAARTGDDPVARWALLLESRETAAQAGDLGGALGAVEAAAASFDVDPVPLKTAVLASAARTAKAPREFAALAEAQDRLAEELVAADQYEAADKAAAAAVQLAGRSKDAALATRAAARARDVGEARSKYQAMKGQLETLAKDPENAVANLEMGRFLCFYKGGWDVGLRFLAKGSDSGLKALAEKELAFPSTAADQAALGDAWMELAGKEKSGIRKTRLQERARSWYDAALTGATGLLKVKLEKAMAALEVPSATPIDLLRLVDPERDALKGIWAWSGEDLASPSGIGQAHLELPYQPPVEYDLKLVLTWKNGAGALDMGITGGGKWFTVIVNGWGASMSGIWGVDGKSGDQNETTQRGAVFVKDKTCTVLFAVRRTGLALSVDGKVVIKWAGDFSRIVPQNAYSPRNPRALFLGTYQSGFHFSGITVTPLSPGGKRLR